MKNTVGLKSIFNHSFHVLTIELRNQFFQILIQPIQNIKPKNRKFLLGRKNFVVYQALFCDSNYSGDRQFLAACFHTRFFVATEYLLFAHTVVQCKIGCWKKRVSVCFAGAYILENPPPPQRRKKKYPPMSFGGKIMKRQREKGRKCKKRKKEKGRKGGERKRK